LDRCKLYGVDQITAELISQVEGKKLCSEICKFIKFIWSKKELPEQCPLQFSQFPFISSSEHFIIKPWIMLL
jgi:hypothetical protein